MKANNCLITELNEYQLLIEQNIKDVKSSIIAATTTKNELDEQIKDLTIKRDEVHKSVGYLERTYNELSDRLDAIQLLKKPVE